MPQRPRRLRLRSSRLLGQLGKGTPTIAVNAFMSRESSAFLSSERIVGDPDIIASPKKIPGCLCLVVDIHNENRVKVIESRCRLPRVILLPLPVVHASR